MPPSSTNIKNPKEVHFFRAGYRDATNYKEGLKPKDRLSFNKDEDSDAETRIQNLLTETRDNDDIKEVNVYVRRRYFPIMPAAYLRKTSPKSEDEKQNTNQCQEEKEQDSPKPTHDDDKKNNDETTNNKLGLDEVTKDFDDIMNVVVLDEALPEVHKFQTQVECTNFEEYNLPEGARVVGDRVIIPPRPGLFGGMTEETTVPLSFYKKSTMPTPFGAPGGSSLFGTANLQPGESLFGTANNSIPVPSGGLFGGNTNTSSLFGGTGGGGGLFSGSNAGATGKAAGGFNFGAAAKSTNNNNDGFLFGGSKKTAAATKPVTAKAKPAKVGSTSGLFGAPSTSHQSAFSFKFNEEPEIEF